MSDQRIALYQTEPHPCGYLGDRDAVTLFLDPKQELSGYGAECMAQRGFRRSGKYTYKPFCPDCQACISVRTLVQEFTPNRTQRKILMRNQDLVLSYTLPSLTLENYRLYRRYIQSRHKDGDMYPPTAKQFMDFLGVDSGYTRFWNLRSKHDDRLVAVAVTDHHPDSLSAVYSFFDPNESKRSLGVYLVLQQIAAARQAGHSYLYLGYWIQACRKMRYKTDFMPQEHFHDGLWQEFSE